MSITLDPDRTLRSLAAYRELADHLYIAVEIGNDARYDDGLYDAVDRALVDVSLAIAHGRAAWLPPTGPVARILADTLAAEHEWAWDLLACITNDRAA